MQTEYCELCGEPLTKKPHLVQIEGAKPMKVCDKCAKLGTEIQPPRPVKTTFGREYVAPPVPRSSSRASSPSISRQPPHKRDMFDMMEGDVAEDYGKRIATARQAKGYSQNDLAFVLKMQEIDIKKLERGERAPTEAEREKLEKELGITLLDVEQMESTMRTGGVAATTLGDVLQVKKR